MSLQNQLARSDYSDRSAKFQNGGLVFYQSSERVINAIEENSIW